MALESVLPRKKHTGQKGLAKLQELTVKFPYILTHRKFCSGGLSHISVPSPPRSSGDQTPRPAPSCEPTTDRPQLRRRADRPPWAPAPHGAPAEPKSERPNGLLEDPRPRSVGGGRAALSLRGTRDSGGPEGLPFAQWNSVRRVESPQPQTNPDLVARPARALFGSCSHAAKFLPRVFSPGV